MPGSRALKDIKDMLVIYHANCADGSCAAAIAKKHCDENEIKCEFLPANYGDKAPDCTGKNVFILDFSYPTETIERIADQSKILQIIDHHKTAKETLSEFILKNFAIFDMEKSGARLTWEFFFPEEEVPDAVLYVEDRDLWKWEMPHSKEYNAAIRSLGMDLDTWGTIIYSTGGNFTHCMIDEGRAIMREQKKYIDAKVAAAWEENIGGYTVPCINNTYLVSEVGEALCEKFTWAQFSAQYFEVSPGVRVFSLRSRGDFDVSDVAKIYGGGGHKNAAGFKMTYESHITRLMT